MKVVQISFQRAFGSTLHGSVALSRAHLHISPRQRAESRFCGSCQQNLIQTNLSSSNAATSSSHVGHTASVGEEPTSAETARTVVEVMSSGTLSTLCEDGVPLGTYTSYVLEESGQPLLRLRADAVHKANLLREPRCSLFVQPQDMPTRLLARVTLIGRAEPVDQATSEQASELHRRTVDGGVGVDAPQSSDRFFRLSIERCFYVGGMGTDSRAEIISPEEFRSATPDILRTSAPTLVTFFNQDRSEDVMRIAAHASSTNIEQIYGAELLWVDRIGAYVAVERYGSERKIHRVQFQRPVMDDRDARSVLTMLAQYAWEQERNYSPPVPEAVAI